uniref:Leucine-rich repeat-containing N-terminal plant-type domain-containing protein n=1 Tax=Oryza brachyantha TaxID=4533 RepID=J3NDE1_ORYBR
MALPNQVFVLCIFILVCRAHTTSTNNRQESMALLQWKSTLDSINLSPISSWSPANSTCSWYGVLCNATEHVIKLHLPEAHIKGHLDAFNFTAFPHLIELNLCKNHLVGAIPASISQLKALTYLDLSFC